MRESSDGPARGAPGASGRSGLTRVKCPASRALTLGRMKIERLFTRHVMATTRSAAIAEAAAAMQRFAVGMLLVMEDPPANGFPSTHGWHLSQRKVERPPSEIRRTGPPHRVQGSPSRP